VSSGTAIHIGFTIQAGIVEDDPLGNVKHVYTVFSQHTDDEVLDYLNDMIITYPEPEYVEEMHALVVIVTTWLTKDHALWDAEHAGPSKMSKMMSSAAKIPQIIITPVAHKVDDLRSRHAYKASIRAFMAEQGRTIRSEKVGGETK
jgi:hypothetical protein